MEGGGAIMAEPATQDAIATFVTDRGKMEAGRVAVAIGEDGERLHVTRDATTKEFAVDAVLEETATQQDVNEKVAQSVVQDAVEGYHGTILAYGQTATGKMHTMMGNDTYLLHGDQRGVVPRALRAIFEE